MDRSMSDDVGLPSGLESTNCTCKDTKVCLQGWAFWPQQQECYQLFTQGPCHKVGSHTLGQDSSDFRVFPDFS